MRPLVKKQRRNQVPGDRRAQWLLLFVFVLVTMFIGCGPEAKKTVPLRSEIDGADTVQLGTLDGTGIFVDGWVGDAARIMLGNPGHTRLITLAGTNVQTGAKDEAMVLRLEFNSGKTEQLEVGQTGEFERLLLVPSADALHDTLVFRMSSSKTFIPSRIGTSKDDRTLSFRLSKIALVDPSALSKNMPETFEFPRQQETDPNLVGIYRDGWIGDSAVVTLSNLQGKKTVEIRGFAPPDVFDKIATLETSVRGLLLVKEQIPKQNQGYFRSIIQIPDEFAGLVTIPFTLRPSGTFVPARRGINADQRRISFQIQYIGLK